MPRPAPLVIALLLTAMMFTRVGAASSQSRVTNQERKNGWISVVEDREPIVTGSGNISRQVRSGEPFSAVHVQGPFNLFVTVGAQRSLVIETDDNLVDRIHTRVNDGELRVETAGSFRTRSVPVVRVSVPRLDKVVTQGNGDARITGLNGGKVELVSQGSGDIAASGRVESLTTNLYGSGNADLLRVRAPDLRVAVYGSGRARVHATKALNASVFGSGRIDYSGNPSELERSVLGSGGISRVTN